MHSQVRKYRALAALYGTMLTFAIAGGARAADDGQIAVDIPRNDSDFWTTYAEYVPKFATELGINLTTTNSQNDVQKLVANAQAVVSQGA